MFSKCLEKFGKIFLIIFFIFLFLFNVNFLIEDKGWSTNLINEVLALPEPPDDGSGSGGSGNSNRGWQFLYADYFYCQVATFTFNTYTGKFEWLFYQYPSSQNVYGCVLYGADIPADCVPGQALLRIPSNPCPNGGYRI